MALKPIGGEDVIGRTIKSVISGNGDDILVFEDGTFCRLIASMGWDPEDAAGEVGHADDAEDVLYWEPTEFRPGLSALQTHEEWETRMAEKQRQREAEAERQRAAREAAERIEYARLRKKFEGEK